MVFYSENAIYETFDGKIRNYETVFGFPGTLVEIELNTKRLPKLEPEEIAERDLF